MSGSAGNLRWERVRLALGVYKVIKKQRATSRAQVMQQLRQRLLDQERDVVVAIIQGMATTSDGGEDRRHVERARGKWRGSTLAGLMRGDEQTIKESFGFPTKEAFDGLVEMLKGTLPWMRHKIKRGM